MALWQDGKKQVLVAPHKDAYLMFNCHGITTDHATTIAVGQCYVPTDYWVGMNRIDDYELDLITGQKIFRRYFQKQGLNDSYFADIAQPRNGIVDIFRLHSPDTYFVWLHHSLGVALHVALWMGFKKLHFVGLTAKGYENIMVRAFLNEFARLSEEFGIDCISCTSGSSLNGFMDYMPVDEALDISKSIDKACTKAVNLQPCTT